MAGLAMIATAVGTAVSFVGTLAQAQSQRQQAEAYNVQATAEQQAAQYKARETERVAQESRAAAQRKSHQQRRQTEYTQSRLQAGAAASGAGADDPTIIKLSSDIAGEGEYSALSELFSGESRAQGLESQAALDRYTGDARANSLRTSADIMRSRANMTILGGVGGLAGNLARFG